MAERLLDRYYPLRPDGVRFRDGTRPFYDWILASVPGTAVVLNVGAGPTPPPARAMRGKFKRLEGVDPDSVVLSNTDLDLSHVNDGIVLPFQDASFDAAYSDWTLEHVEHPIPFLREVCRVLKPGASFWSRTPNRWHYVTLVSATTPHWFHMLVANRIRGLPVASHDPWPTYYRLNTPRAIRSAASTAGFSRSEIRLLESQPNYLKFNPIAFLVGVGYERLVNRFSSLDRLRFTMLVRMEKPPTRSGFGGRIARDSRRRRDGGQLSSDLSTL
jgi:SAM-dependent methyltransferase